VRQSSFPHFPKIFDVFFFPHQQLQKVTAAAKCVREAKKFPKIIEVILAVGNAMNGTRRAPVYGFRMSSLDSVTRFTCKMRLPQIHSVEHSQEPKGPKCDVAALHRGADCGQVPRPNGVYRRIEVGRERSNRWADFLQSQIKIILW
jgi:hypothetical protein